MASSGAKRAGMAGEKRALDSQKSIADDLEEDVAQPPSGMEQILVAVAASVMHSASGMSKWGIADVTLGLYKLYSRHTVEEAVDTITGVPVVDKNELDDMLEWLGWATAAYENDKLSLASTMKVREEDIVKLVATSSVMQPAYHIVVHRDRQCVVMSIRGTYTAKDVLTDLNPHSEPFEGGLAHSGMLAAARWLLQHEGQTLHDVLQANPGFALVLVGHSLGAGTASLLSIMLHETESTPFGPFSKVLKIPSAMVTCWGFGCPPCVDLNLAVSSSFVSNVVLQDDVVARVSPAALEDLRSEMDETDWSQAFKDGTTKRIVVEMLQTTVERFQQKKEVSSETLHVLEKTKDVGYSSLLNVGNTILSRMVRTKPSDVPEPKKPNPWLALGAAAATSFFAAASDRVKQGINKSLSAIEKNAPETDEGVAASALAVNAATSTSESKQDILVKNRLFVPGILFHITRKSLQAAQKQANQEDSKPQKFRYKVVKGTDPSNSRFSRIVLSGSMLSDHSTPSYLEALVSALQNASESTAGTK